MQRKANVCDSDPSQPRASSGQAQSRRKRKTQDMTPWMFCLRCGQTIGDTSLDICPLCGHRQCAGCGE